MKYTAAVGVTIGALTLIEKIYWVGGTGRNYAGYLCRCVCGETARVRSEDLTHGKQLYCTKKCSARNPRTLEDWLSNTKKVGDCLLWQGTTTNGYGRIQRKYEVVHAHREVHRLATGESPEVVMHVCDTPLCINPEHLRSGTGRENTQDMVDKGRQARGARNASTKLTEQQAREIRAALAAGVPILRLARAYGISRGALYAIRYSKSWSYIK